MKNTVSTIALATGLLFAATAANAADVYSGSMKDTSVPGTVVTRTAYDNSWTGFRAGVYGAYVAGEFNPGKVTVDGYDFDLFDGDKFDFATGMFGGQIGYDFQGGSKWVFGVVADIGWLNGDSSHYYDRTDLEDSYVDPEPSVRAANSDLGPTAKVEFELDQLATLRGRIGYLAKPNLLVYATGGVAIGWTSLNVTAYDSDGTTIFTDGVDETHVGYAVGGGVDYRLNKSWSVGAEYLYIDLGDESYKKGGEGVDADLDMHAIKVKLNYLFK